MSNLTVKTFKKVLTEYTSIGKLDERNYKGNIGYAAVTNIMLHPVKDKELFDDMLNLLTKATGKTEEQVKNTKALMKFISNEGNNFYGYYKIKVRRAFWKKTLDNGRTFFSCGNIKGKFDDAIVANSKSVNKQGQLVNVVPNYNLFVHDATGDKVKCLTGRLWDFQDSGVHRADVQIVVEAFGKQGVVLTFFKYRLLEKLDNMHSSNFIVHEEEVSELEGVSEYVDAGDEFSIDDSDFDLQADPSLNLDEDDEIIW